MRRIALTTAMVLCEVVASANTLYVSIDSPGDGPGTSWDNAFHTIQQGVDAAAVGDTVLVTNGVYDSGGVPALSYQLTNRVVITKNILVESVNGPEATFIVGASDGGTNGPAAIRGVYMNAGVLSGFTITNGHTLVSSPTTHDQRGGGIMLYYGTPVVSNCVITGNSADLGGGGLLIGGDSSRVECCEIRGNECLAAGADGGGVFIYSGDGQLRNCLLSSNTAENAGGGLFFNTDASNAVVESCTVTENTAEYGGGVRMWNGTMRNCIIYGNTATISNAEWSVGGNVPAIEYSCTTPTNGLPGGIDCIEADPLFVGGGDYHLQDSSPCIDAGTNQSWMADATDLGGAPRVAQSVVDIGAYEFYGDAEIDITTADAWVGSGTTTISIEGTHSLWAAGSLVWSNCANGAAGAIPVSGTTFQIADIPLAAGWNGISVTGTNLAGETSSDRVSITRSVAEDPGDSPCHYVSLNGGNIWPYTNWTEAAVCIQNAVDAAAAGDTVLVTNGVYDGGGAVTPGYGLMNRVVVRKDIHLRSVNGPACTIIAGAKAGGGSNGVDAVRGVYLEGAMLSGFTVTNGATYASDGTWQYDRAGGGLWLADAVASNCVVCGNDAATGGGVFVYDGGTLVDCGVIGNTTLNEGGGIRCYGSNRVEHCTIADNSAAYGAGLECGSHCVVTDCVIRGNTGSVYGAGIRGIEGSISLIDCSIISNTTDKGLTGGVCLKRCSDLLIERCDISYNRVINHDIVLGAGGFIEKSSGRIVDCSVIGNSDDKEFSGEYMGLYFDQCPDVTVDGCTFSSNRGTGVSFTYYPPYSEIENNTVTNCTFTDNACYGFYAQADNVEEPLQMVVTDCVFSNNGSVSFGANVQFYSVWGVVLRNSKILDSVSVGLYVAHNGTVENCLISGNEGGGVSAGGYGTSYEPVIVRNCVITNNHGFGGVLGTGPLTVENCLLAANTSSDIEEYAGGLTLQRGTARNCTIAHNAGSVGLMFINGGTVGLENTIITGHNQEWKVRNDGSADVTWSNCYINNDPLFVDWAGGDYHLQAASPCIDAGTPSTDPEPADLDGTPRPLDGDTNGTAIVDIGCYEYLNAAADSDGDTMTDGDEVIADTDPTDAGDWFHITVVSNGTVYFDSSGNRWYTLLSTTNLADGVWTNVPGQSRLGIGGSDAMVSTNAAAQEFFKLEVQLP